mmetsp:Transcript_27257/g.40242  ORF Transcript_27257/g.40242 Transcript_27257/m.40242 type:complete len:1418 (-) Transcript_27257:229-4482(-)|eukprot:CAMPEP_0194220234 /NCGR_PEP_ID=MMETSP0156-20130528/27813_1 /TAXON_ID=33649 /ORGANISM="Thalassionema nitzschioides, Strain L26-B" /LENGTH=1417 /DNA_ID=CAMNT_0038950185 /DNA_START=126 /DNA_END=4379 /DNA_ORIENTATION=-
MASINKLSIRGIRAFSPDDDEQVIEFLFPVTVIVGANGCGKTTIIESLKYAVTGALPPGKNAGQSFVHDPKSLGQSNVKANIKLRFTNRAGKSMVLVRAMELTQAKVKLTFKALDGVLRMTDESGKRVSMSHKCTELDRQIPLLLGVSKPILEHVIFCHQEESSWPLQDSASLKVKFDAIFDSTRYTKALKNLDETKKEMRDVAKDLKADVAGLASHKHAAKDFRKELEDQGDMLEELEVKIEEASRQLADTEKDLTEYKETIESMEELQTNLEEKKNEQETLEQLISNQERNITENMTKTHSARQLQDMLSDFEDQVHEREEKRRDLERSRSKIQQKIESIASENMELQGERGRLEAAKDHHRTLLQQRLSKMEDIAGRFGIELTVSQATQSLHTSQYTSLSQGTSASSDDNTQQSLLQISESDMKSFLDALVEKETELKTELKNHRARAQAMEDQVQDVLNELITKSKTHEAAKNRIANEIREANKELGTLKLQGGAGRVRQSDIDEAKRQSSHFAEELEKANKDPRKSEIPVEMRSFEDKIDKLSRQIEDDQRVLADLRTNADSENEITVLKEQLAREMEALQEQIEDRNYEMERHKLEPPNSALLENHETEDIRGEDMVLALETLSSDATEKLDAHISLLEKAQEEVTRQERSLSEKKALLSHNQQSLEANQSRINELEEGSVATYKRIVAAIRQHAATTNASTENLNEDDPQGVYNFVTERLADMDDLAGDSSKSDIVSKVIKRLMKMSKTFDKNGDLVEFRCPCCETTLEDLPRFQSKMKELADPEISPLIKADPEKLQKERAAKANYERWRKTISQCIADVGEHKRLLLESKTLNMTIAEFESAAEALNQEITGTLQANLVEEQTQVDELRLLTQSIQRWVEDVNRIASKKLRVSQKYNDLTMSMTALDTGNRDLRTVERDLEQKRDEKDTLNKRVSRLQKEFMQLNTKAANLSASASRTEQLVKDREAKFAKEKQALMRRTELNEKINQWQDEEKKIVDQMASLRPKIRVKENEKQKQREHSKEEEERLSSNVSSFTGQLSSLKNLDQDIAKSDANNSDHKASLETIEHKLQILKDQKKEQEARLKDELQPELDRIQRSIADQESHRTMISGNLELLKYQEKLKSLEKEMNNLEHELENIEGHDVAMQEYAEASKRKAKLLDTKARLEGRRGGFAEQIRSLKRKLLTPEYKNIDERHRQAMIKHDTTNLAVSDLDKYKKALDSALLRYHGLKIQEINKIIRELWTLTYKGQDITNIEIVSGQDSSSRAAASYNYRVVMSKGGASLDMRGRCSAGQRVLASIVIRLALAETFCVNFGCIALDEPTVNLDYHNKKGLASALCQIISSRANQSNFQLVVITHDEDFVSMMKTELSGQTGFSMPEKYFQVRREEGVDNRFYSRIEAIDWSELL